MKEPSLVYVLDDEAAIGTLVCQVLGQCGLHGTAFQEPSDFISKVALDQPRLIILDLSLGRTDAIEVIRSLEGISYQGNIILMSGRSNEILVEVTQVGVSRGLSMLPPLHKPFRAAELKARLAVTPAKQKILASPGAVSQIPEQTGELAEALQNDWLELWYQPKINLRSLSICGAEALVRLKHPQLGILLPGQFLPAAGDPLYHPLSAFVLERFASDWSEMATQGIKPNISINIPASVVLEPGFITNVRKHIPSDKLFPGLVIEVTEDEMFREAKEISEIALQLKLSNVALSIDDFGTAHASLARLRDVPCAELKLDRSFVANCADDGKKHSICATVVALAKKFDVSVCAEGVENREDLVALIAMGVDTAQGYLFAKPMPVAEFTAMMLSEALHSLKHRLSDRSAQSALDLSPAMASNAYANNDQPARREGTGLPMNYYFNARR